MDEEKKDMHVILESSMKSHQRMQEEMERKCKKKCPNKASVKDIHGDKAQILYDVPPESMPDSMMHMEWNQDAKRAFYTNKKLTLYILAGVCLIVIVISSIAINNRKGRTQESQNVSTIQMMLTEAEISEHTFSIQNVTYTTEEEKQTIDQYVQSYIDRITVDNVDVSYFWIGDFPMMIVRYTYFKAASVVDYYYFSRGDAGIFLQSLPEDMVSKEQQEIMVCVDNLHAYIILMGQEEDKDPSYGYILEVSEDGENLISTYVNTEVIVKGLDRTSYHQVEWQSMKGGADDE